jgi:hypothetical protein
VTTPLERPLSRERLLDGNPYKVVISPEGLRLTAKGRRKGIELSWETIIALAQDRENSYDEPTAKATDVPQAIAADLARDVRAAGEALKRARITLERAGQVPAALLAETEPDPIYGRPRHESNWFIEPLLTEAEVSAILRLSRAGVKRLHIRSITLAGERRYRQSELRRYLNQQETIG